MISKVIELICLVYHEARNVRHLIEKGILDNEHLYKGLTNLPRNRDKAWHAMSEVRNEALKYSSARDVADLFYRTYGISLDSLYELYLNPCWKDSKRYGGNKWAPICDEVRNLIKIYDGQESYLSDRLYEDIFKMRHNTGFVGEKLSKLKSCD